MKRRVLKMLGALGTGTGVTLVTQLLLPPAFLYYYGVRLYGEWIVLSGAMSYLATLNFGISTYAANELTMLRKRGELSEYRTLQASSFALLLGLAAFGSVIAMTFFLFPLGRLLHLSDLSNREVELTAFYLALQMMVNILAGYLNNLFMVVEMTHRGLSWAIARYFAATAACVTLVIFRVRFHELAMGQLLVVVIVTTLSVIDLKGKLGGLPLGLKGANWHAARKVLRPSGMFGLISTQQFLAFQAPAILLQWLLGPAVVVLFSTSRTILSSARQALALVTNAIAPEITFSYARRDMTRMLAIFHHSEKIVFAGIPIANLGALLFAPVIVSIWLHQPKLFDLRTYALMALVSAAISMRDHKQFFQFSTNVVDRLAKIVFFGNLFMIALSVPLIRRFGLIGFLSVWLASEMLQMTFIYIENKKLLHHDSSITLLPVIKLVAVMLASLAVCIEILDAVHDRPMVWQIGAAGAGVALLAVESYWVFGLKATWSTLVRNMRSDARPA